jgi:hypothetical protein
VGAWKTKKYFGPFWRKQGELGSALGRIWKIIETLIREIHCSRPVARNWNERHNTAECLSLNVIEFMITAKLSGKLGPYGHVHLHEFIVCFALPSTSSKLLQLRVIPIENIRVSTIVIAICVSVASKHGQYAIISQIVANIGHSLPERVKWPTALWITRLAIPTCHIERVVTGESIGIARAFLPP